MRLLIAAGGTGGGVYPALAAVAALQSRPGVQDVQVQWVGVVGGMEAELVRQAGLPYRPLQGGQVAGVGPFRAALSLVRVAVGIVQALRVIRRFRPHVVFVTGGYVAVAAAIAARLLAVPVAVYLPDIEPGRAVRFLARLAQKVMVTAEASRSFLPEAGVVVTGYPVRPELAGAAEMKPQAARAHFGLAPARPTVLVFGGSRGARSLNRALLAGLAELLARTEAQVIHISGTLDWSAVERRAAQLSQGERERYRVYPYLHEDMGIAMAAADIVVSRAGASTLGEFPIFGLGAIVVPYPHAWRYQKVNADVLQSQGAAICINDEQLAEQLAPALRELLADPDRMRAMGQAARALAAPAAAERVADELVQLARGHAQP